MEHSPSLGANSHSADHEIPAIMKLKNI